VINRASGTYTKLPIAGDKLECGAVLYRVNNHPVLLLCSPTAVYASTKNWAVIIPAKAWTGGIASAILIGATAGLMPAIRASRMPPTVALRTV
jgi:ABC-type antimicrobial peptide transport system permease subunit